MGDFLSRTIGPHIEIWGRGGDMGGTHETDILGFPAQAVFSEAGTYTGSPRYIC